MQMYNTVTKYKVYLVCSLLCAVLSILGEQFNTGILDYVMIFSFFVFSFWVFISRGSFVIPKRYFIILILYLFTVIISSYLSSYTLGIKYILIGTVITITPFLLFIVSYNYNLTFPQIERIIDIWIYFIISVSAIAIIETIISTPGVAYQEGILKISVVKPGFYASLSNQGVILSLFRYSVAKNKRYLNFALFFTSCSMLTIQLKVIIGLVMIWMIYYMFIKKTKISNFILISAFVLLLGYIAVMTIPQLQDKIYKYTLLYAASDSYELVARPALYYQSINIANDFFPWGSGQGTFGSVPVNMLYNQIYYDYDLNHIHGLGETGDNFKMDTHWSSIIGENGYLGTIIYLMLFLYPICFLKKVKCLKNSIALKFLILTVFIVVTFESITLCIPGRMAFMFIYSGILGLISRDISNQQIQLSDKK